MAPAQLVFWGACAFLCGVLAASVGWHGYIVLSAAMIALGILCSFKRIKMPLVIVAVVLFFFGIFYYHLRLNIEEASTKVVLDSRRDYSGIVISEPTLTERTQQFLLRLEHPYAGKVRVITDQLPERQYGDRLRVTGAVRLSAYQNGPRGEVVLFFPDVQFVEAHQGFWLKERLLSFKNLCIGQFRKLLPSDEAALMAGLTFGARSDFSSGLKQAMSFSGTTHLVALSGYNIAILVMTIAATFGYFFSRRITFWLTTCIIFLFVLMVGAESSVVRAAIMGFLVLLAKETERLYSFYHAVVLVAAAMVLWDPSVLVFNLGFQLSFLSLLGIVYLGPLIKRLLSPKKHSEKDVLVWRENAATTIAAQLTVAPLVISSFGQMSLTSFLANVLILVFVPVTMALGFLLALLGMFIPYVAIFVAWAAHVLLAYEIGVIRLFAHIRLPIGGFPHAELIFGAYYAMLIAFVINTHAREHEKKK